MNKRAALGLLLLISFVIAAGLMFVVTQFFEFGAVKVRLSLEEEIAESHGGLVLLNYLRTPAGDSDIGDLLLQYATDDSVAPLLRSTTNEAFGAAFGSVYWQVEINGKELKQEGDRSSEIFFEGETVLPGPDGEVYDVRLTID